MQSERKRRRLCVGQAQSKDTESCYYGLEYKTHQKATVAFRTDDLVTETRSPYRGAPPGCAHLHYLVATGGPSR